MPTYDYLCQDCQKEFEVFQRMSDDPLDTCPSCGGTVRRRITGGTGLIFKGSGFYLTDYKGNGNGNGAATDNGTANGNGADSGDTPKSNTSGSTGTTAAGSGDASAD